MNWIIEVWRDLKETKIKEDVKNRNIFRQKLDRRVVRQNVKKKKTRVAWSEIRKQVNDLCCPQRRCPQFNRTLYC